MNFCPPFPVVIVGIDQRHSSQPRERQRTWNDGHNEKHVDGVSQFVADGGGRRRW